MSEVSNDVHIVYIEPIADGDEKGLLRAGRFLPPDELERAARFRFEAGRLRFITGRALVRTQLSRMVDVAPRDWRFTVNRYGRPEVAEPPRFRHIRFNLSRTDGLVMCGLSDSRDLGVDTERIRQPHLEIVDRFFAPSERLAFHRTEEAQLGYTFFKYWTLKEAYVKARGRGLSIALDSFAIDIRETGGIALSVDRRLDPRRSGWIFGSAQPTGSHVAAFCVDGTGGGLIRLLEAWAELGDVAP